MQFLALGRPNCPPRVPQAPPNLPPRPCAKWSIHNNQHHKPAMNILPLLAFYIKHNFFNKKIKHIREINTLESFGRVYLPDSFKKKRRKSSARSLICIDCKIIHGSSHSDYAVSCFGAPKASPRVPHVPPGPWATWPSPSNQKHNPATKIRAPSKHFPYRTFFTASFGK